MKTISRKLIFILFSILFSISCTNTKKNSLPNGFPIQKKYKSTDSCSIKDKINSKVNVDVNETLGGWLKELLSQRIVIDSLGIPENKNENSYWEATGTYVQQWEYKSKGITLEMESEKEKGNKKV